MDKKENKPDFVSADQDAPDLPWTGGVCVHTHTHTQKYYK